MRDPAQPIQRGVSDVAFDRTVSVIGAGALFLSSAQRTEVRTEKYAQQISAHVQDRTLQIVTLSEGGKMQKLLTS